MLRVGKRNEYMRFITYPRVSWFLMELGVVRPAAMLGREQFNSIIHIQQAKPASQGLLGGGENRVKGDECVSGE